MKENFYNEYDMKNRIIDMDTEDEFDSYLEGWYNTDRYVLYIIEEVIDF